MDLFKACDNQDKKTILAYLEGHQNDPNITNDDGQTMLGYCAKHGYTEIVKLLLEDTRIDRNKLNKQNRTPFYQACVMGHVETVKVLLDDSPCFEYSSFLGACANGHVEIVKLLLESPTINLRKHDNCLTTGLIAVCSEKCENSQRILMLLLNDSRIDPNEPDQWGNTPFHHACNYGTLEKIRLLLEDSRVDPNLHNHDGQTAFNSAYLHGRLEHVRYLLTDPRIDVRPPSYGMHHGMSLLHTACERGWIDIIQTLLDDPNIDPNQLTENGHTPLLFACLVDNPCVVKLLLENGADVSVCSGLVFYWATIYHDKELIDMLSNETNQNIISDVVSERISSSEYYKTFKLLLDYGAPIF